MCLVRGIWMCTNYSRITISLFGVWLCRVCVQVVIISLLQQDYNQFIWCVVVQGLCAGCYYFPITAGLQSIYLVCGCAGFVCRLLLFPYYSRITINLFGVWLCRVCVQAVIVSLVQQDYNQFIWCVVVQGLCAGCYYFPSSAGLQSIYLVCGCAGFVCRLSLFP